MRWMQIQREGTAPGMRAKLHGFGKGYHATITGTPAGEKYHFLVQLYAPGNREHIEEITINPVNWKPALDAIKQKSIERLQLWQKEYEG